MQDEANLKLGELEVTEKLCGCCRIERQSSFCLDYDRFLNDQIHSMTSYEDILEHHVENDLLIDPQPRLSKSYDEGTTVPYLFEAVSEVVVDLVKGSDDSVSNCAME